MAGAGHLMADQGVHQGTGHRIMVQDQGRVLQLQEIRLNHKVKPLNRILHRIMKKKSLILQALAKTPKSKAVIPQNTSLTYDGNNTENQNQVFMSAGFKTRLNKNTKITPSVFVKYASNSPLAVDLNVKVDHNSDYWYGVSTRYKESVNVFAGLNINMTYDITYAFEWSYSKLSAFNSGTHEIILGLRLQHPNIMVDPSKFW